MRVALISEHASPLAVLGGTDSGGQNVYVDHVARCLARAGHSVDVFTRRDSERLPAVVHLRDNLRVINVTAGPARFVPKEQMLALMPEFVRSMCRVSSRRPTYDLAHANFFMSGLAALRLKERFGTPFVVTFHALGLVRRQHQREADGFPPERIPIEAEVVRKADRIIAQCPQDHSDLVTLYQADRSRISTVPCGFDHDEFGPTGRGLRERLGIGEDEFVVLQLGRLVPRKGIDNVIHAVAALERRHGLRARLLVVGGNADTPDVSATPEIGRLRAIADQHGLGDRVLFTGRKARPQLCEYYGAADVFVTTPWYEPFGITPIEAMACGTPVIGSAVGGIKETVVDGVTGFLVPPRDPDTLADRLAELARNPALARAMGRAGMRRARSLYTWDRVAEQLARVYESVVGRRQAADADHEATA